jgi:hypothetical protein
MSTQVAEIFSPRISPLVGEAENPRVDFRFLLRAIVVPFVYTRLILLCAACFAVYRLPGARAVGWDLPTSSNLLNMWSHFDGRWYLAIARDGYQWIPNQQCGVVFSPLYPLLMRYLTLLIGTSDQAYLIAGLIISNAALIIAIFYVIKLLMLDGHDRSTAIRASWYILLFPTSFFLSAVYPMSLFMALAAAAFYHARKQQWNLVGVLAGLAALSRPDGVLLTAGLAVEYYLQYGFSFRRQLLPLILGPIGTISWMAFQWIQFGDPLAFIAAQKQWSSCPLTTVLKSSHAGLQLGSPALFLVLTFMAIRRLRPSLTAFLAIMFAIMLSVSRFWSITRFILVLFPAFMMLAILARKRKIVHILYLSMSTPLSVILMMRFSLNLWVA